MRVCLGWTHNFTGRQFVQEDAENCERHRSPERVRAAADAAGLSSPWIERELKTLRTMCENNKRDHDKAQVCTSHHFSITLDKGPGLRGAWPGNISLQAQLSCYSPPCAEASSEGCGCCKIGTALMNAALGCCLAARRDLYKLLYASTSCMERACHVGA